MTTDAPWTSPPEVTTPNRDMDVEAYALGQTLTTLIELGAASLPRATQVTLGSSEAGHGCDRRIAYKLAGTPAVNHRDPLRSVFGSEHHGVLAEIFKLLSVHSGRYLVETPITYRGVPGTCDLFDVVTGTVIDWKTTLKNKISHLRSQGPSQNYEVQTQLYGAGMVARGYTVNTVALVFLPVDGELKDAWVWRERYDQTVADNAVDRIERLRGSRPEDTPAKPDRLCGWCSHYQPNSIDLSVACPGKT